MRRPLRPLAAAMVLSAAGPAAAQALPLTPDGAPWWAVLLATAAGPAATYTAGLFARATIAASAASLRALAEGRGLRGAAGAAAGALERMLSAPADAPPQLPPASGKE